MIDYGGVLRRLAVCACVLGAATPMAIPAAAQQQLGSVGGFEHDSGQPIEIGSDSLEVRQEDNTAVFVGNVDARQGGARLQANRVEVSYDAGGTGSSALKRLRAEGDVHISSAGNVARGDWADYDVPSGIITMGDDVLLSQGPGNAIQGSRLRIDLNTGRASVSGGSGGVSVVFSPATAQ